MSPQAGRIRVNWIYARAGLCDIPTWREATARADLPANQKLFWLNL